MQEFLLAWDASRISDQVRKEFSEDKLNEYLKVIFQTIRDNAEKGKKSCEFRRMKYAPEGYFSYIKEQLESANYGLVTTDTMLIVTWP